MRARAILGAGLTALVLLCAGSSGAEDGRKVVLAGGAEIEVARAAVQGGLVYLTLADGRMQAYPVGDVDLVASGLAPAAGAESVKDAEKAVRPRSMTEAQSRTTGKARLAITDDDVAHVRRDRRRPGGGDEGEEEAEGAANAPRAALLVSGLSQEINRGLLNLSGTVQNSGSKPVSTITLEARAENAEGGTAGHGTTVISQQLEPEQSVSFTMSFPVDGAVTNVRVRASAAIADFEMEPVEPPAAEAGEPGI